MLDNNQIKERLVLLERTVLGTIPADPEAKAAVVALFEVLGSTLEAIHDLAEYARSATYSLENIDTRGRDQ